MRHFFLFHPPEAELRMAAVNVRQLSDSDLRERLKSFGQNVGPITNTTRIILEKKLSKFLDSNVINNASVKEDAVKKKHVAKKRLPPTGGGRKSTTRKFAPLSSDEEEDSHRNENYRKTVNRPKNDFVDPNDTNISIIPLAANSIGQIPHNARNRLASSQGSISASSSVSTPLVLSKNEFSDDDFYPANEAPNTHPNADRDVPVQNSSGRRNSRITNHISDPNVRSYLNTPAVRGRYTKFTTTSPPNSSSTTTNISNMRDEIDASLIQIRKSYTTKKPSPTSRSQDESEKEDEEIDAEFVSEKIAYIQMFKGSITGFKITVLIIVLLLVGLYLYNGADNGIESINSDGDSWVDAQNHYQVITCLYQKLSVLAGDADCGYIEDKWINKDFLQEFADPCLTDKTSQVFTILNNTMYANYIEVNRNGNVSSKSSYRSLGCRVNQALSVIVFRIIMVITIIACVIGGYFVMKKRWTADDEEMRQILHFVERIIDTLQRHHEVCQTTKDLPPFLPIPHVRDMIIPLAKRKKMARIWRKAVAFLNSSDSRVRVETQRIAGEDFDVWRWIGVCTPKLKKEKKATNETYLTNDQDKCWQGPAFDEIEKVVRMPIVTPTPCLKIRYMHEGLEEKDDKWIKHVENAVLEKCNQDGAQILHIFVDKTSKEGCVYVKCDSLESAGKAFRCMYGNWFDCRLVIVKFVTLARYHQRFPDALRCAVPLQPDPKMPSSLNWVAEDDK